MATILDKRLDERIQRDVLSELQKTLVWNAADVGVTVYDGIVTLTGSVDATYERATAECAALRVPGVRGVANELMLGYPEEGYLDAKLARAVSSAVEQYFAKNTIGPSGEHVTVTVSDGWVTLGGMVGRCPLREDLERIARELPDVQGVTDVITTAERPRP